MKKDSLDKKETAANYILTFYEEVKVLILNYSNYLNFLVELDSKYGKVGEYDSFEPEDHSSFITMTRTIRQTVITTYMLYRNIKDRINDKIDNKLIADIDVSYVKIKSNFTIDRDILESYVVDLNKFLTSSIMDELLDSSEDFINKLYKGDE